MMPAKIPLDHVPELIVHLHPLDGGGEGRRAHDQQVGGAADDVRTPSSLMRAHDHATSPERLRGCATLNSAASPDARVTESDA